MIDSYDFLRFGGVAYEERLQKGLLDLSDIVRTCAAAASAIVALIRLVRDIVKDKEQKSNRPHTKE